MNSMCYSQILHTTLNNFYIFLYILFRKIPHKISLKEGEGSRFLAKVGGFTIPKTTIICLNGIRIKEMFWKEGWVSFGYIINYCELVTNNKTVWRIYMSN